MTAFVRTLWITASILLVGSCRGSAGGEQAAPSSAEDAADGDTETAAGDDAKSSAHMDAAAEPGVAESHEGVGSDGGGAGNGEEDGLKGNVVMNKVPNKGVWERLHSKDQEVRKCYHRVLSEGEEVAGKMGLKLILDKECTIKNVTPVVNTTGSEKLYKCIRSKIKGLRSGPWAVPCIPEGSSTGSYTWWLFFRISEDEPPAAD